MFDDLPIVLSILLHISIVIFLVCDFSSTEKSQAISVPVFTVDLTKVKIAEMTNLPPKLVKPTKSKKSKAKKSRRTSSYSKAATRVTKSSNSVSLTSQISKSTIKSASKDLKPTNSANVDTTENYSGAFLDNELNDLLSSVTKTDEPKKTKAKPDSNSIKSNGSSASNENNFHTLLASVDGIKESLGYAEEPLDLEGEDIATQGIEGGHGGSYMQDLTVSEKDLIGLKLRGCWNIDMGVRGAQDMLVEIRVFLTQEGTVKDAKILNKKRYNKDTAFRSVAESARRAIYICDKKKEDSPFRFFADNYAETYDTWKTLLLRFNPLDGGVM